MRLFAFALIFFASFAFIEAWIRIQKEPDNFDGYCHDLEENGVGKMKVGEVRQLMDICGTATCEDKGIIKKRGCVVFKLKSCTQVPGDPKALYPECCDTVTCQ